MKKAFSVSLIVFIAALSASAQSNFYSIIESVLGNDKELHARQLEGEASVTYNDVEGPSIDYEHIWPNDGSERDGRWSLTLSQEFDYPGLYSARSKVSGLERENASLVLLSIRMDKALSAKQLIIDIINSHRRMELYRQVRKNLKMVDSLTRVAYDQGEATSLDLWKMQLAVLENKYNLAVAEGDIRALEGALAATGAQFINGEEEFWHDYPLQQLVNPADAPSNSLAEAIMQNSASLGKARVKALKLEAVPSFAAGYKHSYEENTHFNGFTVGLRLPSFSQKKKNKVAALEAEAVNLGASYEVDRQRAEMLALYEEALTLSRALDSYRSLTGDGSYLRLLDKSYKAGQLTIIDYLNEINLFIEARLGFLDLEYRYNLALARLNRYRSIDF